MNAKIFRFGKFISVLATVAFMNACNSPSQTELSSITGVSSDTSATPTPSSSSTPTPTPLPAHTIQIFNGNGQTAVNGNQLSNPLTAKVIDANGNPVSGVSVTFAAATGGGTVITGQPVTTDSGGQASSTVILGATVGTQTFTATMASGTTTVATFTENSTNQNTLLKIFAVGGSTTIGATGINVGNTINLRAVLVDVNNNFVKEIPATWWTTGTLNSANLVVTGGNPSKYASFSPTTTSTGTINALIDDAILIAANNITSTTTATGQIISTLPLTPETISIYSGNLQSGQVGTDLAQNIVAKVVNSGNAAVPGVNVTFAVQTGGGQIISAQPVVTDSNGLATCTVRLGGSVGNTNSFTATMPSGSSTQVSFSATGTVGPASQLVMVTQPSGGNTGSSFSIQPVLEVRDSYGNKITSDSSSTATFIIEPAFGGGTLSGSTTATAVNGVISFTNLTYNFGGADTTATPIKIRASSSIGGVSSVLSNSFTIGQIITAGQCLANGSGWDTRDGGCKDLTNGIVWSALSSSTMNWHQAVWAFATSGSTAPEAWEIARGITFDYTATGTNYDASSVGYCHDLVESGFSDWRLPTIAEINASVLAGTATGLKSAPNGIWGANVVSGTVASAFTLHDGTSITATMTIARYARCVRQPPPTQLVVTQQIAGGVFGLAPYVRFATQPIISLRDNTNSTSGYATNTVTLSVKSGTGTGQLCTHNANGRNTGCGSSISVNAVNGIATFSNVSYSKPEAGVIFTATSPGLASVDLNAITFNQTWGVAACKSATNNWINATGGCKDLLTGLIWSSETQNNGNTQTLNWHDAVWDQAINPSSFDATKDMTTNDYDPTLPLAGNLDNSTTNYCHDLQESGQEDWFLPSLSDFISITTRTPSVALNVNAGVSHWSLSSTSTSSASPNISVYNFWNNSTSGGPKSTAYTAICTRRDPPATLAFSTQPTYPATCNDGNSGTITSNAGTDFACAGAGNMFNTMPSVIVKDSDGAGPLMYDNSVITLTVVPASDGTGGTGRLLQYGLPGNFEGNRIVYAKNSITTTASNGTASFTNLAYEKAGEKFRLRATGTVTWHNQVYNLPATYSNDLQTSQTHIMSRCKTYGGFSSQNGGCHNTNPGGLVWTYAGPGGTYWANSIWDSALGDPRKVLTSDGVTLEPNTSEMDASNSSGVGTDNNSFDYCHRLNVNGYYDWRMPTYAEMDAQLKIAGGHGGVSALRAPSYSCGANCYIWSSTTVPGTPGSAYLIGSWGYSPGTWTFQPKTYTGGMIFCVRDPANTTSLYKFPDSP